eukprot:PITA_36167
MKKSQDAKAWLLCMRKFFRLHDCSENMKVRISLFSLKGKANIWWEDVNKAKDIHEDDLTWHAFERLFKKKYLFERYYDDIAKDFYELRMGSMTNEEYTSRFFHFLRYVPYLREEKAKVQRFISGFLVAYIYRIEFDDPRSLEEAIQYLKHCYEQSKRKVEPKHDLQRNNNAKGKWSPKRGRPQNASGKIMQFLTRDSIQLRRDMERRRLEVVVGNHCSVGYVLSTSNKKQVHLWVRACAFDLNGMPTTTHLNVFPSGSYSMILGMDWLYLHRTKVDCFDKAIECVDDSGEKRTLQGKKKPTSMRMVTSMHSKRSYKKVCVIFAIHISNEKGKEVEDADVLSRYPILQQFRDVFPKEISELPPHREVDFYIDLVPGVAPASKAPYRMSTPDLVELKLQLKEMLDKGYIKPSVSPWDAPVLFIKKKYGTLKL